MRLSRIVLSATLMTVLAGISWPASAQTCFAVSVRGGQFSCPGCLSPGAMPLQCSVHQCQYPAPAVDGWVLFSAGFSDFATAGASCATLGASSWAGFAPVPPPAPVAAPAPAPVVPVVSPVGPAVAPGPVIVSGPAAPRVLIGTAPNSSRVQRTSKTTVVVAKKKPHVHSKPVTSHVNKRAKQPRHVVVVDQKKHRYR